MNLLRPHDKIKSVLIVAIFILTYTFHSNASPICDKALSVPRFHSKIVSQLAALHLQYTQLYSRGDTARAKALSLHFHKVIDQLLAQYPELTSTLNTLIARAIVALQNGTPLAAQTQEDIVDLTHLKETLLTIRTTLRLFKKQNITLSDFAHEAAHHNNGSVILGLINREKIRKILFQNPPHSASKEVQNLIASLGMSLNDFITPWDVNELSSEIDSSSIMCELAANNQTDLGRQLIELGANVNLPSNSREARTPLYSAILNLHPEFAEMLLANGADTTNIDEANAEALTVAAIDGNIPLINLLLEYGCPVDGTCSADQRPVYKAIRCSENKHAAFLISKGAHINIQDANGNTFLHLEAQSPHSTLRVIQDLIQLNADPRIKNNAGLTPDQLTEDHEIKNFIIKSQADWDEKEQENHKKLNKD